MPRPRLTGEYSPRELEGREPPRSRELHKDDLGRNETHGVSDTEDGLKLEEGHSQPKRGLIAGARRWHIRN